MSTNSTSGNSTGIAILGSTGSVGRNTLDVVGRNRERFHVVALGANRSVDILFEQVKRFSPKYVVISDPACVASFKERALQLDYVPEILVGSESLIEVAAMAEVDCVMAAIVGAAGLLSTLSAVEAGKVVLLANKEALVMAGDLLISAAQKSGATLLPIDSEHNAVFQCLANVANAEVKAGVQKITLTASGGPFLNTPLNELTEVTPDQACAHPNWSMGRKISVDSATMMNKGLEVIEACLLFDLDIAKVNVVIHPQSIVHAMVAYKDGSILAHMGFPDMRVPIAHAIAWPTRIDSGVKSMDITEYSGLEFFPPDLNRFPCLRLAIEVQKLGNSASVAMNAANEVAVQSFLDGKIKFLEIYEIVAKVVDRSEPVAVNDVEVIMNVDEQARTAAVQQISQLIH